MPGVPRTRYARSGDLNIAYQTFGDGPLDLLYVPGFVSHLDLLWENPRRAETMRRLASFARVTTFDKRNTGLSDRTATAPTMEERMDDLRAVMDAAGLGSAAIVGASEGGPLAILLAATYPERVQALVLAGTFAKGAPPDDLEELLGQLERFWGSGRALQFFGETDLEWTARYERSAATPRGAVEILRLNLTIDVSAALPAISAPTLVLHRIGDPVVPVESARELAAGIRGAKLIELEGDTHVPSTPKMAEAQLAETERFLTGAVGASESDRVLATVLFTDIVDSTERAATQGDREWRHRLEQHHDHTDRLLRQYGGRRVKATGDGVLATFDGPARAIRCAMAVAERAAAEGLPIRAGLHAGEVELVAGGDIAGIAVHLAKRVESAATPGTVFVSQTVRDLIAGSTIELRPRGTHELKGIPGSWALFEVVSAP